MQIESAEYLYNEVLQSTRCLTVSVNASGVVTDLACPWGDWLVADIEIGSCLPETLLAILNATPRQQRTTLYPFVYLDDSFVVDVHVYTDGLFRQLILRDVSEIHQAELKFQQKAHEVSLLLEKQSELNRLLELQRAELERANLAKSRFIASMSHEFRTPITSIMGHADLLARQMSDASAAAAIQRASWHLLTLVENLLEQARQGEGIVQLNPTPVDLKIILQDMRDLFSVQAGVRGLELSILDLPAEVYLEVDELRLRQILINLLSNAIRFTTEGRVELAISVASEIVTFEVRDTGPGISVSDQELIFQPFVRLNPQRETGAGLGLSITRQLVEAMGGRLQLDSEPGRGSSFSFSLHMQAEKEPNTFPELDGLTVLLVDDDADILALYELLMQDWGMQVVCASSLPQALELAEQQLFDLVFTDVHLEEGNGMDLLRAVRKLQSECMTVLCSGAGISADWQQRYGEFADEFLLKPVGPGHLRAAISRTMRRTR